MSRKKKNDGSSAGAGPGKPESLSIICGVRGVVRAHADLEGLQSSGVAREGVAMTSPNHENHFHDSVARHHLVRYGQMLHERHYVSSTDGNLSVRLPDGRILTTPTCISKRLMNPEDMVIVDLGGKKIQGTREPSSEIQMHLTIYKLRSDIHAVVHAHPCTATGFASVGIGLTEAICSEQVLNLGEVPLAPYGQPGTAEISESLRPLIQGHDAILLESHGVVTYGTNLSQAYLTMEAVEHCARITLVTKLLGRPTTLSDKDVSRLFALRTKARPMACDIAAGLM
jgi:L-fuculose-phosphate aldolase